MDIAEACKTVHRWAELFASNAPDGTDPGNLPEAVAEVKRYLEREKADGKPIRELQIAEHLLVTREAAQWVIPFVLSAESMEASKRRKAMS